MPAAAFALIELEPARPPQLEAEGEGVVGKAGPGISARQWQVDLLVESDQMQAGVKGGVSAVLG